MSKTAEKPEDRVWLEVLPDMDRATDIRLSKRDQARADKLCKRYDSIIGALEDEPDEQAIAELDEISAEIDALSKKRVKFEE